MAYPTVPDFPPFPGEVNVNLMLGGEHYDKVWNSLEDYLKSLGSYLDAELEKLDTRLTAAEARIEQVSQKLDNYITTNDARVKVVETRLTTAEADIDAVEQRLTDYIATNDKRVEAVEAKAKATETAFNEYKTATDEKISSMQADLAALKEDLTQTPASDAALTAGELAHVTDTSGTPGPGVFKSPQGWLYVGNPSA